MSEHEDKEKKGKETEIVVNGRERTVEGNEISFEAVVALAYNPVPSGEGVVIARHVRRRPREEARGHPQRRRRGRDQERHQLQCQSQQQKLAPTCSAS